MNSAETLFFSVPVTVCLSPALFSLVLSPDDTIMKHFNKTLLLSDENFIKLLLIAQGTIDMGVGALKIDHVSFYLSDLSADLTADKYTQKRIIQNIMKQTRNSMFLT